MSLFPVENDSESEQQKGETVASKFQLPPELICEIFLHLNGSDDNRYSFAGTLLVSQVCSLWREISLAEPRLWSSISMSLDMEFHPIIPIIRSVSDRWYDIDFFFPWAFFAQLATSPGFSQSISSSSAPSLRVLQLRISPDRLSVPWKQISDLSVSWIDPHKLGNLLQKMPNLAALKTIRRPELHVLQNLHITTGSVHWLDCVWLPALRHLTIEVDCRIHSIWSMLPRRSLCTIKTLDVHGMRIPDDILMEWLTEMPSSLSRLELRVPTSGRVIQQLTYTLAGPPCASDF
ncbi:hypothetical protein DFH09DRAFT_1167776 [Mycena vulgaris]|nr:hypothetical protein DFH09DRAFT_1167776 [Mycena vulgaris]